MAICMANAERGDVAQGCHGNFSSDLKVWKSARVDFSTLKLKEIFPVCHAIHWRLEAIISLKPNCHISLRTVRLVGF